MSFLTKLFGKKQAEESPKQKMVRNLSKVRIGMTEKELTNLFGQPQFVMNQSAALGVFGVIAGSIPEDLAQRENWVFKSEYGEFQTVMQKGRVVNTLYVESLLEKVKTAQ